MPLLSSQKCNEILYNIMGVGDCLRALGAAFLAGVASMLFVQILLETSLILPEDEYHMNTFIGAPTIVLTLLVAIVALEHRNNIRAS